MIDITKTYVSNPTERFYDAFANTKNMAISHQRAVAMNFKGVTVDVAPDSTIGAIALAYYDKFDAMHPVTYQPNSQENIADAIANARIVASSRGRPAAMKFSGITLNVDHDSATEDVVSVYNAKAANQPVTYTPSAGEHLNTAIAHARNIAVINGEPVAMTFSRVPLNVAPDAVIRDVASEFHERYYAPRQADSLPAERKSQSWQDRVANKSNTDVRGL